jgi:hypothetical protein
VIKFPEVSTSRTRSLWSSAIKILPSGATDTAVASARPPEFAAPGGYMGLPIPAATAALPSGEILSTTGPSAITKPPSEVDATPVGPFNARRVAGVDPSPPPATVTMSPFG